MTDIVTMIRIFKNFAAVHKKHEFQQINPFGNLHTRTLGFILYYFSFFLK